MLLVSGLLPLGWGADIDTGKDAIGAAQIDCEVGLNTKNGELLGHGWVRLRGADLAKLPETRKALLKLRNAGMRTCVMLRWPKEAVGQKTEDGGQSAEQTPKERSYLPKDLREAYENGRKLGALYGDLVDAWEVDNEPDLGFVPEAAENYEAFLKASYLGLKAGAAETTLKSETGNLKPELANLQVSGLKSQPSQSAALVIMGSLGLPPGPWLERFAANDGFAYTDGFNYHYYGYAEDFTGVYRQHEVAVAELIATQTRYETVPLLDVANPVSVPAVAGQRNLKPEGSGSDSSLATVLQVSDLKSQVSADLRKEKALPIFMTEIGYGMLGRNARDTKEGRLRQWRWFKSVGEQATTLRIEAPMAFYLPPYLEYDTLEFGLTVPAKQDTEKPETRILKPERWVAGGIEYTAKDFAEKPETGNRKPELLNSQVSGFRSQVSPSPWMELIGKEIGGNEITPALAWWLNARGATEVGRVVPNEPSGQDRGGLGTIRPTTNQGSSAINMEGSRRWSVTAAQPSPVVIDFLPGEGLLPLKRYNGTFVMGQSPIPITSDKAQGLRDKGQVPSSKTQEPKTKNPISATASRSEELMIHVRTANGNLYEVYPTRMATPEWQSYLEQHLNFTMSFYGRAELPWRFKDNKPVSIVIVMYPKQLPAVYEFRKVQLRVLGAKQKPETVPLLVATNPVSVPAVAGQRNLKPEGYGINSGLASDSQVSGFKSQVSVSYRYGQGTVVLYNFSEKPVTGKLSLPSGLTTEHIENPELMTLAPNARREVPVIIKVAAERFERTKAAIMFVPANSAIPPARFVTEFFPALEGLTTTVVAALLQQKPETRNLKPERAGKNQDRTNREIIVNRHLASEEAPSVASSDISFQVAGFQSFAQQGALVERTVDGFRVTVTGTPPGKQQRVEVEIPWPDGQDFAGDAFLSLDYRLDIGKPEK